MGGVDALRCTAAQVEGHQVVGRLASALRMALLHGHEPAPVGRAGEVRVARLRIAAADRLGTARQEPQDPRAVRVDEEEIASEHAVFAAPVLVDPRADVHTLRGDLARGARSGGAHHRLPPALLGPPLEPVHPLPHDLRLGQPAGAPGERLGAEGRVPGPIGGGASHRPSRETRLP